MSDLNSEEELTLLDKLSKLTGVIKEIALPTKMLEDGSKFNSAMGVLLEYVIAGKIERMELIEGNTTEFPDLIYFTKSGEAVKFEVKSRNRKTGGNPPLYRSLEALEKKIKILKEDKWDYRLMVIDFEYVPLPKDKLDRYVDDISEESDLSKGLSQIRIVGVYIYRLIPYLERSLEEGKPQSSATIQFINKYKSEEGFELFTKED